MEEANCIFLSISKEICIRPVPIRTWETSTLLLACCFTTSG
jgi:hypothetical protein